MKNEQILSMLEETAEKLSVKLTYENLHVGEVNTTGGICQLKGEQRMIVHKGLSVKEKIEVLTDLLSTLDTEGVHLAPGVRERLDAAKRDASPRGA